MSIIHTNQLTKTYGRRIAVDTFSFEVQPREILGIIGPNGSGKTTLFNMLLGLVFPTSGSFTILDENRPERLRRRIGASLDTTYFYPYLSGYDHINMVAKIRRAPEAEKERILRQVGLWERRHDAIKKYSMGMKQRLSVGIALINAPELVILDEPTNGLDPQGIIDIRQIIAQTAERGATVVLASHILGEIEKVCTRILFIKDGKLRQEIIPTNALGTDGKEHKLFEIGAADTNRLYQLLKSFTPLQNIRANSDGRFTIEMPTDLSTDDLMRFLATESVFVNHFSQRSTDLEKLFLGE